MRTSMRPSSTKHRFRLSPHAVRQVMSPMGQSLKHLSHTALHCAWPGDSAITGTLEKAANAKRAAKPLMRAFRIFTFLIF
jgi:hypothetical protein